MSIDELNASPSDLVDIECPVCGGFWTIVKGGADTCYRCGWPKGYDVRGTVMQDYPNKFQDPNE